MIPEQCSINEIVLLLDAAETNNVKSDKIPNTTYLSNFPNYNWQTRKLIITSPSDIRFVNHFFFWKIDFNNLLNIYDTKFNYFSNKAVCVQSWPIYTYQFCIIHPRFKGTLAQVWIEIKPKWRADSFQLISGDPQV